MVAKVLLDMAISLDGFIVGPNGADGGLYDWYFAPAESMDAGNQQIIAELLETTGAIIMGRNTYGVGDTQDAFEEQPYKVAHFILTHNAQARIEQGGASYTFVTDGIESALTQAQAAAGDRYAVIGGGADTAQQYLNAGLVDEIQLHVVPVLLGDGLRLFNADTVPPKLECTRVIEGAGGVVHLRYRVSTN